MSVMVPPRHYLSIVAVCKDEHSYLAEWIEYHRLVGVEHFYVFDNGSAPPLMSMLRPWAKAGIVTVIETPGQMNRQFQEATYSKAIERFGHESMWMAFIDVDEFILPKLVNTIPEFLYTFEEYAGGVNLNWQVFGSNGHLTKPAGLQIGAFTKRAPRSWDANKHVKAIVQPARTLSNNNVHNFHYKPPFHVHDEHGRIDSNVPISVDKIQLNHYQFRSRAEFAEKVERSKGAWPLTMDYFDCFDQKCNAEDDFTLASRFGRKLEMAL